MSVSLPFAYPAIARRTYLPPSDAFEYAGFRGLLLAMVVSCVLGGIMWFAGRGHRGGQLYRKEAMAIVGLSWVFATVLGALPYFFAQVSTAQGQPITFIEAMFEAQSGFSTTGATVLTNLEDPLLVPHCILFYRSWTHFLGGLGIVVLFVAILGQGSAGKAMMQAEMPGPTNEGSMPRMQHAALAFAGIYVGFNAVLTGVYAMEGMTIFDALCHAFATMATGGFSTYNASLGQFDSALIDYTTIVFMILAGTNFTLLYLSIIGGGLRRLIADVEFRSYLGVITLVTIGVIFFGMTTGDEKFESFGSSLRFGLFQVVSVITTTGYGTADFDSWNNFGRGVLLMLMFVGGCAGSTGGGMKVIRHILLFKVLGQEIEKAHHPRVRRPLRIGGQTIDDPGLPHSIVVYFAMVLVLFVTSWLALVTLEPNTTWGYVSEIRGSGGEIATELEMENTLDEKLLDSASAVAATLNNIGPGLGVVGATQNYAGFSQGAKGLFTVLMMLGRVEIFCVLVMLSPRFWRRV
ncbi:MAG: TrkH family potassium uptake protein [Planctomycetota bacterium]